MTKRLLALPARGIVWQRVVEHQWLAQREVQVDGPGRPDAAVQ